MMSGMSRLTARLAPLGVLTTGFGASIGLAEGGIEELDEFRLSRSWRSRTVACRSRINASSSTIRCSSWTHPGQTGVGDGDPSLIPRQNTKYPYGGKTNRTATRRGCLRRDDRLIERAKHKGCQSGD